LIVTANGRVVGPNYKPYLTDRWEEPYRTARIYQLLGDRKDLRPQDFIQVSTDIYTYPHVLLAQELAKAAKNVQPADSRTAQLLQSVSGWDGNANIDSVSMTFLEFTRRALLYNLLRPHLGENVDSYLEWMRAGVFLEWVLREHPARWLPPAFRSYDELLISSADLAVHHMADSLGSGKRDWEWGKFNLLRMYHPLGRDGLLRRALSIGPVPISGSIYSVKQIARTYGPAMRFVADLSNLDNSLMNLTMGQSGQFLSANYKDQFPAWYEGRGIPSKFSDAAEKPLAVHHLQLLPPASNH